MMFNVSQDEWNRIFPPEREVATCAPYVAGHIGGIPCVADPNAEPGVVRLLHRRDAERLYPGLTLMQFGK